MNIKVNGIDIPLTEPTTISDIIKKFFSSEGEYIIKLNSQSVQPNKIKIIYLCEADELQIISYEKQFQYAEKKTVIRNNKEELK